MSSEIVYDSNTESNDAREDFELAVVEVEEGGAS